ncbi:hypothetical protein HPP92_027312 [Vanilla planifolia]|nr:hypothetical protein HPP92_027312 [Vanilla planifolia]
MAKKKGNSRADVGGRQPSRDPTIEGQVEDQKRLNGLLLKETFVAESRSRSLLEPTGTTPCLAKSTTKSSG